MVIFDCEYDSGGICQTIYSYNCSFRFFILYPGIIFCFFGCMAAYYIQAHQVYQGSGSPPARCRSISSYSGRRNHTRAHANGAA